MRIKKKELRKGLAQLPINYPAPTVESTFDYEAQKLRVEDLCRALAHVEVEVRDAALTDLPRYLKEVSTVYTEAAGAVPEEDLELLLRKLAMGLYYCFWHSDKPLVQHECAFKISQLIFAPHNTDVQRMVLEAILFVLSRQWGTIDRYRLDKYMALVRKIVFQMLVLAKEHFRHGADAGGDDAQVLAQPFFARLQAFWETLLTEQRSVGLTMHVMDLLLDELIRSDLPVPLFVHMATTIALFAMSRGDFVEKRVLDNFIVPIVSGVLDERRVNTIGTSPEEIKERERKKKRGAPAAASERDYSAENDAICTLIAAACRDLSVAKATKYNVRPLMSESQMLLEQRVAVKHNPKQFRRVNRRDERRRLIQELREVDETKDRTMKHRKLVKDEKKEVRVKARRVIKKTPKALHVDSVEGAETSAKRTRKQLARKAVSEGVRKEVTRLIKKKGSVEERAARTAAGESETKLSIKGTAKNSKRKKNVKLSQKDILAMESEETPRWRK